MSSPLDPIKEAVTPGMGGNAVTATNDGDEWEVSVNGWMDGVKFTTTRNGSTLAEAAEKVMALVREMRGEA